MLQSALLPNKADPISRETGHYPALLTLALATGYDRLFPCPGWQCGKGQRGQRDETTAGTAGAPIAHIPPGGPVLILWVWQDRRAVQSSLFR